MRRITILTVLVLISVHCKNANLVNNDIMIYATATPIQFEVEYYNNKSIASKYNNPGNLRPINGKGYRRFNTLEDGYDALLNDLTIKQSGRSRYLSDTATIAEFTRVYAPCTQNNTNIYIKHLCDELQVTANTRLTEVDVRALAK